MDPRGAGHLGDAAQDALHLIGGSQHDVRQLVDDHHDVREGIEASAGQLAVESVQVARAGASELFVALLHLAHYPAQRHDNFLCLHYRGR